MRVSLYISAFRECEVMACEKKKYIPMSFCQEIESLPGAGAPLETSVFALHDPSFVCGCNHDVAGQQSTLHTVLP